MNCQQKVWQCKFLVACSCTTGSYRNKQVELFSQQHFWNYWDKNIATQGFRPRIQRAHSLIKLLFTWAVLQTARKAPQYPGRLGSHCPAWSWCPWGKGHQTEQNHQREQNPLCSCLPQQTPGRAVHEKHDTVHAVLLLGQENKLFLWQMGVVLLRAALGDTQLHT